jgi:NTP pyrophosphatase (non-canonical NTP hydrolase)
VIDEETREKLGNELGDALWYMGALAGEISLTLDQVAKANLEKLASRKERGVLRGSGDDR